LLIADLVLDLWALIFVNDGVTHQHQKSHIKSAISNRQSMRVVADTISTEVALLFSSTPLLLSTPSRDSIPR
jgi:hypothetical protein